MKGLIEANTETLSPGTECYVSFRYKMFLALSKCFNLIQEWSVSQILDYRFVLILFYDVIKHFLGQILQKLPKYLIEA